MPADTHGCLRASSPLAPREDRNMKRCCLCGTSAKLTRDHVPPKGFFVPPLPDNLITVPCCHGCNQHYKKDDEAARLFFSAYRWESDKGKWIWKEKALGSTLQRSPKLRQRVLDSLHHLPVQTQNGVEVMPVIIFPESRMNRFLIRITKGLLFSFYPDIDYSDMHFEVQQITPTQEMANYMSENMLYDERGNGVFRFWRSVVNSDPRFAGIWSYVFYDGMCFSVAHSKDKKDLTTKFTEE